jgi:hypothetical protein
MVEISPRVDPRLIRAAFDLDDDKESMAETCRRVGAVANKLGLPRPSYDTIRCVVGPHRERRREIRRLVAPAVGGVFSGFVTQWEIDRVWELRPSPNVTAARERDACNDQLQARAASSRAKPRDITARLDTGRIVLRPSRLRNSGRAASRTL